MRERLVRDVDLDHHLLRPAPFLLPQVPLVTYVIHIYIYIYRERERERKNDR